MGLLAIAGITWLPGCSSKEPVVAGHAEPSMVQPAVITWPAVPQEVCPLEEITTKAPDGVTNTHVLRKPPGDGPFPAVIFLHGGVKQFQLEWLRSLCQTLPSQTRFLAAGYVTVTATRRSRETDPQDPGAVADTVALVEYVKSRPEVDPDSVVIVGGSGGGSLALELAGEVDLQAIACNEPATMLYMELYTSETYQKRRAAGEDPRKFVTDEILEKTRSKIAEIRCPVLIVQGTKHYINKLNNYYFTPEVIRAGKTVKVITYPGQPHGFFYSDLGTVRAALKCYHDCDAFFRQYVKVQPKPVDDPRIEHRPAKRGKGSPGGT